MLSLEQFRKIWNEAFTEGATQGYELRRLMAQIEKRNQQYIAPSRLSKELDQILKGKEL